MARTLRRVRADKSDSRLRSGSLAYKCMPLAGVPVVLGLLPCLFAIAESDIATVMESFDLVIVGAGVHGLCMLKTYRDVHPKASVLVLDKGASIGGVWARDKLYPGLHTNNHFKTFEYSDLPMNTTGFDLAEDHIPGEHVNEYLNQYVQHFGLQAYVRVNTSVMHAIEDDSSKWILSVSQTSETGQLLYKITTNKLVLATGLTSEPFMPKLDGREAFQAPIYHSSEFAKAHKGLGAFKKVALLSGSKFSWDIACAYASAGVKVDWIIRESGHGPCWMAPNRLTPLKIIPEYLLQTRLVTWLSPCIFEDGFSWLRTFFHQHWLGRKVVDLFFAKMQHGVEAHNNYDGHPETAKLKPWDDLFFIGTNRGLLNYGRDFFELVRNGMIRVYIADISHLSHQTIHLSNSETIRTEVLICGTGWKDTPQLDFSTKKDLGLPGRPSPVCEKFVTQADREILSKYPKLREQPRPRHHKPMSDKMIDIISEPYRLYRFMVPPAFVSSRNLAFTGMYRSPATTVIAQTQALWITAFLDDCLPQLATTGAELTNRITYEAVLHTQFAKWRYSRGFGARFPELWFDCLPYVDVLLKDIGLRNQRKKSWFTELFTRYMPTDYIGLIPEYQALQERRRGTS